jgi:hypothetical protein
VNALQGEDHVCDALQPGCTSPPYASREETEQAATTGLFITGEESNSNETLLEDSEMSSSAISHRQSQSRKAAASGWIGSALEYYDFFIYATAASLIFPQLFFPSGNPTVAIVASLATYGVGYVARPIGAFVLGHWATPTAARTC